MANPSTLRAIRLTHHYSGIFIAPAVLFFAITGFLQTFSLHESTRGSSYVPPALIVHLTQLHKKATLAIPQRAPQPGLQPGPRSAPASTNPSALPADPAPRTPETPQPAHLPMKIFFGLVASGLIVSTLTGVSMAWKYNGSKVAVSLTLLAGAALPLLLLLF